MDLTERRLSGEQKYSGVIISVTLDKVELCDGKQTLREVVHHPGGVGVLPLDEDGNVYMVRQYRYPVGARGRSTATTIILTPPNASSPRRRASAPMNISTLAAATPLPAIPTRSSMCTWRAACTRGKATWTRESF